MSYCTWLTYYAKTLWYRHIHYVHFYYNAIVSKKHQSSVLSVRSFSAFLMLLFWKKNRKKRSTQAAAAAADKCLRALRRVAPRGIMMDGSVFQHFKRRVKSLLNYFAVILSEAGVTIWHKAAHCCCDTAGFIHHQWKPLCVWNPCVFLYSINLHSAKTVFVSLCFMSCSSAEARNTTFLFWWATTCCLVNTNRKLFVKTAEPINQLRSVKISLCVEANTQAQERGAINVACHFLSSSSSHRMNLCQRRLHHFFLSPQFV